MTTSPDRPAGLLGRRAECEKLSGLVAAAKARRSQVLVLRGEAGIGKTALLDFLLQRATGCRVLRAAGAESEMELAFAGLHQLCGPHVDRLGKLPQPQQEALSTAFGLCPGTAPDRYLLGLAVFTLFSQLAEDGPLICVVDDAQWLDQASAEALEFVARRLTAEPVGMFLAVRESDTNPWLAGLPQHAVPGLPHTDAAVLLASAVTGALDPRVRDRILAESHGNPLALLELPRGLTAAELAFGGDSGAAATPLVRRLENEFLRQVQCLPGPARMLLLTAAAEPLGEVSLLRHAAQRLGIPAGAADVATATGLIELRERVRFRHPLVRTAVYRSADRAGRRDVHRALADVTDPELDPDRRAWHHALATVGQDEAVAAELEHSADRALAHGGLAAAAAFLERAATLTPDPVRRARRCLDAAHAKVSAGALGDASTLLATAEKGVLLESQRARIDLLRAEMSFAAHRGNEALPLLLAAAHRLQPVDASLARDTRLDALSAALLAGRLAVGPGARQVAEAVREAPPPAVRGAGDVLLEGLAVLCTEGYAPAAPLLRRAVRAFVTDELTLEEGLRSLWLAAATAASLWDDVGWAAVTDRHLDIARETGALGALPLALNGRTIEALFTGDLATAASLVAEAGSVTDVTRGSLAPYGEVGLLALRGDAATAEPFLERCLDDVTGRGEGLGVTMVQWARAVLFNGRSRYRDALGPAREAAASCPLDLGPSGWALAELVEAGMRTGRTSIAEAAAEQLSALTRVSGTDWALGVAETRRALLCDGDTAEQLYRAGIGHLGSTRMRVDLARAQLLYGEWLRRQRRRVEARAQLRAASAAFGAMGLAAFAERAGRELSATGETARKRTVETAGELTTQEAHIARLAARGLTNPEIGAALSISPRTVEWHLSKAFPKLGISTRRELRRSMPDLDRLAGVG